MNDKNSRGKPIIEVKNLSVHFQVRGAFTKKRLQAVSDVSLEIYPSETYGIVGESGCGFTEEERANGFALQLKK